MRRAKWFVRNLRRVHAPARQFLGDEFTADDVAVVICGFDGDHPDHARPFHRAKLKADAPLIPRLQRTSRPDPHPKHRNIHHLHRPARGSINFIPVNRLGAQRLPRRTPAFPPPINHPPRRRHFHQRLGFQMLNPRRSHLCRRFSRLRRHLRLWRGRRCRFNLAPRRKREFFRQHTFHFGPIGALARLV